MKSTITQHPDLVLLDRQEEEDYKNYLGLEKCSCFHYRELHLKL